MSTRIAAGRVRLKRAYDAPEADDGKRILVDRLWPRGLAKADAQLDQWMKEVGPSTELRQWFGHDAARWDEFRERYRAELREHANDYVTQLRDIAREDTLTLVYAAHDAEHNNAVVLRELLLGHA